MDDDRGGHVDYFEVLGVPRSASTEEIAQRVKQELRTWQKRTSNPDLARRQEAEQRVQLLSKAKQVLLDDGQRAAHLRDLENRSPEPEPEPRHEPRRRRTPDSPAPQPPRQRLSESKGIDWMGQARRYLANADYQSAAYAAREARERDERSADAWSLLARASTGLGNLPDALVEAQRSIELAPNHLDYRLGLGAVYEQLQQWQDAATVYLSAADLDNGDDRPRIAAANAWIQAGAPAQACEVLEDVVRRDRDNHEASALLGDCLVTLAESVPRYRNGANYFVTSKAEMARMHELLARAEQVTDDLGVRDRVNGVRRYLRWCDRRHWDAPRGIMARFCVLLVLVVVAFVIVGATSLQYTDAAAGVTILVMAAGIVALLYFIVRTPGWKRNRNRLR